MITRCIFDAAGFSWFLQWQTPSYERDARWSVLRQQGLL